MHQIKTLRIYGNALQNSRYTAYDNEVNVVSNQDLNEMKESVLHRASPFPLTDAFPRVSEGIRADSL